LAGLICPFPSSKVRNWRRWFRSSSSVQLVMR
jgi:hypothetical protein